MSCTPTRTNSTSSASAPSSTSALSEPTAPARATSAKSRQHLGDLRRQRAALERAGGAEAVEEPLRPGTECLDALVERGFVGRQQRLEFHLARLQHGATLVEERLAGDRPW